MSQEKVMILSVVCSIFHQTFSISFLAIDSTQAIVERTNFIF
jgi:hypothetical protein